MKKYVLAVILCAAILSGCNTDSSGSKSDTESTIESSVSHNSQTQSLKENSSSGDPAGDKSSKPESSLPTDSQDTLELPMYPI